MSPNEYVGIPFKRGGTDRDGLDCWGLLQLYYIEQLKITLNSALKTPDTLRASMFNVKMEILGGTWERIDFPEKNCAVALAIGHNFHHVGIYVGAGEILHATEKIGVCINRLFTLGYLYGYSRVEFYRWRL